MAIPELIRDVAEIERLLPTMAGAHRMIDRFIGVPIGPGGRPDPTAFERAVRDGFAVVRLRFG